MGKSKLIKLISQIVFFGAIWGIVEASLGYVLHLIPIPISGLIMFPIATFILVKAYKATDSRAALIVIGFIAAAIKSIDLLLPGLSIFKTINPMFSIVLEAVVVAVAYPALTGSSRTKQVLTSIGVSVGWRGVFILYMLGQYLVTGNLAKYLATPLATINFIVVNGVMSGLIVAGALWIEGRTKSLDVRKWGVQPVYAVIALALALGIQYMI
ncbi:hypothetical protein [Vallitalea okinawensis]|uniref:hypothetical protein n=1 Tax=Vallitalea okinawensis TaxID=2078660 RepID=UPI000CFDCBD0|nr:hypothetical protein [Vallitalea okinawensis]